jgi:transposase, IS6 family
MTVCGQPDYRRDNPPPSFCSRSAVRPRQRPLPTRHHRPGGPLVPARRVVRPQRRELLAERDVQVDHVSVCVSVSRWVQRFTPLRADAARPCRHLVGIAAGWTRPTSRWPAAGWRRHAYRAVDQAGQVIDVLVSVHRDLKAARRLFERASNVTKVAPVEVVTDRAATDPIVVEGLLPAAWHRTDRSANSRVEADYGRLNARLRPMRGLKQDPSASIVVAGHALVQNLRRGHDELAVEEPVTGD